ncbi:MAG TPA: hypothetical protein VGN88_08420 [Phycisphaerae bacterium]|jgi:hypothetical protein
MTMSVPSPDSQLQAYYEADTRYSIIPIPAPVDRTVAELFAIPKIIRTNTVEHLAKLSRLCIFHNLTGTAKSWEAMIARPSETAPADVQKSAHAIAALAWVGTPEQWKKADDYFKGLLARANPDDNRESMAIACNALGPAEGTASLKAWANKEADRLEKESIKPTKPAPPETLRNLGIKADMIRQFANLDTAQLEREFNVRRTVEAIAKPEERAPRLASIYCETGNENGASLVWWAACMMIRQVSDADFHQALIDALLRIAQDKARVDKVRQPELDATRSRALRAGLYFTALLEPVDQLWLPKQKDLGADLLVLRPNWKYAAPHAH